MQVHMDFPLYNQLSGEILKSDFFLAPGWPLEWGGGGGGGGGGQITWDAE